MMRVLRRGLVSLAVAGPVVVGAMLFGPGALAGVPRSEPAPDTAAVQYQVKARPTTIISRVVCDEGIYPHVACRVSLRLGPVNSAHATTYDQEALADKDYTPLKDEPVKILDRDGSAEVFVDLLDDKECESTEDFLVVVTGPEVQVTAVVSIVDNDC